MNRRVFLATAAAGVAGFADVADAQQTAVPESIRSLKPMTGGVQPIGAEERQERIDKARRLMKANKLASIVIEGGSSMFYFTGTRWPQSDRLFAVVLPAKGDPVWIVHEADQDQARKAIHMGSDIRVWNDQES